MFFLSPCRTLETEELRKKYISPPVPDLGQPLEYPDPGQPWIGRRLDYILYCKSSISKPYRTVCIPVFLLSASCPLHCILLIEVMSQSVHIEQFLKYKLPWRRRIALTIHSLCLNPGNRRGDLYNTAGRPCRPYSCGLEAECYHGLWLCWRWMRIDVCEASSSNKGNKMYKNVHCFECVIIMTVSWPIRLYLRCN